MKKILSVCLSAVLFVSLLTAFSCPPKGGVKVDPEKIIGYAEIVKNCYEYGMQGWMMMATPETRAELCKVHKAVMTGWNLAVDALVVYLQHKDQDPGKVKINLDGINKAIKDAMVAFKVDPKYESYIIAAETALKLLVTTFTSKVEIIDIPTVNLDYLKMADFSICTGSKDVLAGVDFEGNIQKAIKKVESFGDVPKEILVLKK